MSHVARWVMRLTVAGALIASAPFLASNNLLPRRVFLHGCAVALLLAARRSWKIPGIWVLVGVNALVVWMLSPVRAAAVPGLLDGVALVGVVLGTTGARAARRVTLPAVVAIGVVGALVGLAQQWVDLDWWSATRPAGLFASRATAAALVVAVLPLVGLTLQRRPTLLVTVLALGVAFVVTTRARAAWVALVVVVVLALLLRRQRRALLLAALAGVAFAAVATPGPRLHWSSPSPLLDSTRTLGAVDLGDRPDMWRLAIEQVAHQPWGFGPGAFQACFGAVSAQLPASLRGIDVESPHDDLVLVGYETGLQGLALVVLGVWPRRRASVRTRLLQVALLSLLVCGLTGKVLEVPPTGLIIALLIGLLARGARTFTFRARWFGQAMGCVLVAAMVWVDGAAVHVSFVMKQARVLAAQGRVREAFSRAEEVLPDSVELADWEWVVGLLNGVGDKGRCLSFASQGLALFPGHAGLTKAQADCR